MRRKDGAKRGVPGADRPGYGTFVSAEAIREWMNLPASGRLQWVEEMIELESKLPRRIREAHRRMREAR